MTSKTTNPPTIAVDDGRICIMDGDRVLYRGDQIAVAFDKKTGATHRFGDAITVRAWVDGEVARILKDTGGAVHNLIVISFDTGFTQPERVELIRRMAFEPGFAAHWYRQEILNNIAVVDRQIAEINQHRSRLADEFLSLVSPYKAGDVITIENSDNNVGERMVVQSVHFNIDPEKGQSLCFEGHLESSPAVSARSCLSAPRTPEQVA